MQGINYPMSRNVFVIVLKSNLLSLKEKLASTLKPAVKVNKPVGTIDSEPNPETGTGSIPASGFDPETDENVEHKTEQWNLVNGEKKDKHGFDQHPAFVKLQVSARLYISINFFSKVGR